MSGRDHFTELNGLGAHYVEWGPPDGAVVIALHGLRSYARTWEGLASALPDHRVIALDHRGRGDSDWDPAGAYFTPSYVSDVEQLIDHLAVDRVSLVGHSMGGTNALVIAGRHRDLVERLVVEDIGPGSSAGGEGAERVKREVANTPRQFSSEAAAIEFWRSIRPNVTDEALASRVANTLTEQADGTWTWKYDLDGIAAARLDPDPARHVDLWPSVEQLDCPTLVVRGANSDFLPMKIGEEMCRRNRHIRLVTIDDAGHYVHDDNPADYFDIVRNFFDDDSAIEKVSA